MMGRDRLKGERGGRWREIDVEKQREIERDERLKGERGEIEGEQLKGREKD